MTYNITVTNAVHGGLNALLRYPKERAIKSVQKELLIKNYSSNLEKLIVFLTPGLDIVNGGILSISFLYEETKKLSNLHGAETILCTIPGDPALLKYSQFKNNNLILDFFQALNYFKKLQSLVVHVPECYIEKFVLSMRLSNPALSKLLKIRNLHFNVLLQNIRLLSSRKFFVQLGKWGKLTFTTAHEKYSSLEIRNRLGFPLHKLSSFGSPERYIYRKFAQKEDLMVVSPDVHPIKEQVLAIIAKELPDLKLQIIHDLTYEEYKEVISKAKWALTFGEGLDGYFLETIYSGGISFSVYNSDFFTEDFKTLRTVYESYDALTKNISADIKSLNSEPAYNSYQQTQFDALLKYYQYNKFAQNMQLFYQGKYTFS
jgi:hypothetical protein